MPPIKLLITGGTIDAEEIDKNGEYIFKETHIPQLLKQSRNKSNLEIEILFMKDSALMTDEDREIILKACENATENRILITHGTDTMVSTAEFLAKKITNKTVILFGSMRPANQVESDALFNLGFAIASAQMLPNGIYITFNGTVFDWDNAKKNTTDPNYNFFETIK